MGKQNRCEHVPQPGTVYARGDIEERRAREDDWPRSAVCDGCGRVIARSDPEGPWVLKYSSGDRRLAAILAAHPEITVDDDEHRASWMGDGELRKVEAPDTARLADRLEAVFGRPG